MVPEAGVEVRLASGPADPSAAGARAAGPRGLLGAGASPVDPDDRALALHRPGGPGEPAAPRPPGGAPGAAGAERATMLAGGRMSFVQTG